MQRGSFSEKTKLEEALKSTIDDPSLLKEELEKEQRGSNFAELQWDKQRKTNNTEIEKLKEERQRARQIF